MGTSECYKESKHGNAASYLALKCMVHIILSMRIQSVNEDENGSKATKDTRKCLCISLTERASTVSKSPKRKQASLGYTEIIRDENKQDNLRAACGHLMNPRDFGTTAGRATEGRSGVRRVRHHNTPPKMRWQRMLTAHVPRSYRSSARAGGSPEKAWM